MGRSRAGRAPRATSVRAAAPSRRATDAARGRGGRAIRARRAPARWPRGDLPGCAPRCLRNAGARTISSADPGPASRVHASSGGAGLLPRAGEASPARCGSPRRPSSAARARSQSGRPGPRSHASGLPAANRYRYRFPAALARAWKDGRAGAAASIRTPWGSGVASTSPARSARRRVKLATCPSACTPASVRAAPCTCTRSASTAASASSNACCTVGSPGCRCQPRNAPPS